MASFDMRVYGMATKKIRRLVLVFPSGCRLRERKTRKRKDPVAQIKGSFLSSTADHRSGRSRCVFFFLFKRQDSIVKKKIMFVNTTKETLRKKKTGGHIINVPCKCAESKPSGFHSFLLFHFFSNDFIKDNNHRWRNAMRGVSVVLALVTPWDLDGIYSQKSGLLVDSQWPHHIKSVCASVCRRIQLNLTPTQLRPFFLSSSWTELTSRWNNTNTQSGRTGILRTCC